MRRRGLTRGVLVGLALIAPVAGRPAHAQTLADYDYTTLGFRGAGVAIGRIWPTKVESTPVYSLRIDLGYLGPGLRIAPSLSYWSSSMRSGELNKLAQRINALPALQKANVTLTGADLGPVKWSDLALDLDGEWVITTPSGLLTYAGLGLGLHALSGRGAAIQGTFVEDLLDTIAPAATGIAGLEFRLGEQFRVFSELRLTAMGDIQYGGLRLGGALMVPGRRAGGGTQ